MPTERSVEMADKDGEIKVVTCAGSGLIRLNVQAGPMVWIKLNLLQTEAESLGKILAESADEVARFDRAFEAGTNG